VEPANVASRVSGGRFGAAFDRVLPANECASKANRYADIERER
jgi:hypothetical protein